MTSTAPARPRSRPTWSLVVAVAAGLVILATTILAPAPGDADPAGAQATCLTARNSEHVSAGRATRVLLTIRAVGSNDSLGFSFQTTSLQQDGPNVWRRVTSCTAPPSSTTSSTTGPTTPPGGRPPLTQRYTGTFENDSGLPGHTIYRPSNLASVVDDMPVVVWGNGACSGNGTWFQEFLTPLSAHGVLVIASGTPNGSGSTDSQMLLDAITWAANENSRPASKYFGRLDPGSISAMGQSCGGLQAIDASRDARVDSTILWNSGIFASGGVGGVDKSALTRLHAPVAWFTGGRSDIAYSNAVDDYQRVPARIPAVLGHYGDVGHTGLFSDPAVERHIVDVAADWLDATLYGNAQARAQFVGTNCGLCVGTPWNIQSKNWS
jgi:hypothetical protein